MERTIDQMEETVVNDCSSHEIDISGPMHLKSGNASYMPESEVARCGTIRQEIEMRNTSNSTYCSGSDFDGRRSCKKISVNNTLEFEVVNYTTLKVSSKCNSLSGTF